MNSKLLQLQNLPIAKSSLNQIRNLILNHVETLKGGRLVLDDPFGEQILGETGPIRVMDISNPWFYPRLLISGSIGLGETYADGWWDSDNLFETLKLLLRNRKNWVQLSNKNPLGLLHSWIHWTNENTIDGSRKNIRDHYDLGNEFYELLLDETMTYSCGIHSNNGDYDLRSAQINKFDRIGQKLKIGPSHHLLEIGSGWGSFAVHAASEYGCSVTTTTISSQQYKYVQDLVRRKGLTDRIDVLNRDYRELSGEFDRLVSIEMIEAVGLKYLPDYLQSVNQLLTEKGQALIQGIHMVEEFYQSYKNSVDFIQRYIFPGGHLPSIPHIASLISDTGLKICRIEEIGTHYVKTLRHWKNSLRENKSRILSMGFEEYFTRLWEYYFSYCQAGFDERHIGVFQMQLQKNGVKSFQKVG